MNVDRATEEIMKMIKEKALITYGEEYDVEESIKQILRKHIGQVGRRKKKK